MSASKTDVSNKAWWILGIVAVTGFGLLAYQRYQLKKQLPQSTEPLSIFDEPAKKILKRGSRGEDVKELQRWLSSQSSEAASIIARYGVDGIFGPDTEKALVLVTGKNTIEI